MASWTLPAFLLVYSSSIRPIHQGRLLGHKMVYDCPEALQCRRSAAYLRVVCAKRSHSQVSYGTVQYNLCFINQVTGYSDIVPAYWSHMFCRAACEQRFSASTCELSGASDVSQHRWDVLTLRWFDYWAWTHTLFCAPQMAWTHMLQPTVCACARLMHFNEL